MEIAHCSHAHVIGDILTFWPTILVTAFPALIWEVFYAILMMIVGGLLVGMVRTDKYMGSMHSMRAYHVCTVYLPPQMMQRFGWNRAVRRPRTVSLSKVVEGKEQHHDENGTNVYHHHPPDVVEVVDDDDEKFLHHGVSWWYLEWVSRFRHHQNHQARHQTAKHNQQEHQHQRTDRFEYEDSDFAGRRGCVIVDESPKRVRRLSRRFSFAAVSTEVVMIIMGTISYIVYHGVLAFSVKTPVDNRTYDDEVVLPDSSVDLVTQDITLLQVLFAFWFVATIFNSIVHIQLALAHYNEKVIQAKASSNFSLTLLHILKYFNMTQALIRLISQPPAMWQCHNLSCVRNYFLSIASVNSLVYT